MEAKSLIRVLKMQRGRYAKKANAEAEKKTIESIVEKNGGKLEVSAVLKENKETELLEYVRKVLGLVKTAENKESKSTEKKQSKKQSKKNTDEQPLEEEFAKGAADGNLYRIDSIKGTCKKVFMDLSELNPEELATTEMSLTTYQRYLKDNFPGETCTVKKGKLHFRGYRISCDIENGFIVEDTTNKYEIVDTPFEGIPTPKELGEWFKKPIREFTEEELRRAVELGKEQKEVKSEEAVEEIDYEKLRRKVLGTIKDIRSKTLDFDPTTFPSMIPFKRWKRKANSLVSQWKERKIRYSKFLNELEKATTEETFVVEEKKHRSAFKGSIMPTFSKVGSLVGNKIEVDGKKVDAVPFLLDYLLCVEHRAMAQLMKFATEQITLKELLNNPTESDWKVEYDKSLMANTADNAVKVSMVYDVLGIALPYEVAYETGLEVGDKINILLDGELKVKAVTSIDERGVFLGKSVGYLLKADKWFKREE